MNGKNKNLLGLIVGFMILISGFVLLKIIDNGMILGGIFGVSFPLIFRSSVNLYKYKGDSNFFIDQKIEENDERFIMLRHKAAYSTWYITMIGLVSLSYILLVLGERVASLLSLGLLAIHIISLIISLKYYNDKF